MIRKTIFAVATVAALAATSLAPTEAAAKGGRNFARFAIGTAIILGTAAAVNASCWRYYENRYGEVVKVWVCN